MSFRGARPSRSNVKKGIDAEESRHKRQEVTVELRKNKREESMQKRRHLATATGADVAQTAAAAEQKAVELMARLQQLPQLVAQVMSDDEAAQIRAVADFRKLLSIERNPPIQQVIDSGVVPRLVQFLRSHHSPVLQVSRQHSHIHMRMHILFPPLRLPSANAPTSP